MNAPMLNKTLKTIYGKSAGIKVPDRVKKLLAGAEVVWWDKNPLSQDMDDALHFFFDSHTNTMTDLLLKRYGLTDVSQYVNIPLLWEVKMDLVYSMPNHKTKKQVIDTHYFNMRSTIFPMSDKFRKERDAFYFLKNLEHLETPDDHKNKAIYETTKFSCVVIGV
jgi:hypothetical protein